MGRPVLLIVDDNEDDVFILQRALRREHVICEIRHVADGPAAVDYLIACQSVLNQQTHPLPALILLDLHLPGLSGPEVLSWIREQPPLYTLPVVILSGSSDPEERLQLKGMGVTGTVDKTADYLEAARAIKNLLDKAGGPPA